MRFNYKTYSALLIILGFSILFNNIFAKEEGAPAQPLSAKLPLLNPSNSSLPLNDYSETAEKIFIIRNSAPLEISNRRGSIEVVGWSQDKIKVIAKKRAQAADALQSQQLLKIAEPRYVEHADWIELTAHYGGDLGIKDRIRERAEPKVSMDLLVYAPVHLKLTVFGTHHPIRVSNWKNEIVLRSTSSEVQIKNVASKQIDVTCPDCNVLIESSRANLKCHNGTQKVSLKKINAESVFVETTSGMMELEDVSAKSLLVSKSGEIRGLRLIGGVEFQTASGNILLKTISGPVSGKTEVGNVDVTSISWGGRARSVIESLAGQIDLTLPPTFSADVEIRSENEAPLIEFPVKTKTKTGLDPKNVRGRIGFDLESGYLKIESINGKIKLKKGT